jgi:transcriptional regulator with XRE-family HTH domain
MAIGGRRIDRARERALDIRVRTGREVRVARRAAGLSLRAAGAAVGISPSAFSRIERAIEPGVTLERLCLACAAVGLDFGGRTYLNGEPVRDAGHLRLLARLRAVLPPNAPWRVEIPIVGDSRAVDALTRLSGKTIGFEAELRLEDLQALARKLALKRRDAGLDVLVLVVADTRHNRSVLEVHADALKPAFPLPARVVLSALRRGEAPSGDGLVVL